MPVYVVAKPESVRGIYDSWAECKAKVESVAGGVYQKAEDEENARALLDGSRLLCPQVSTSS